MARLASYDKNLKERAGARVSIVIAVKEGDPSSERAAGQLASAFSRIDRIAGLPHDTWTVPYANATTFVETCKNRQASIVVVTDALTSEVAPLRASFESMNVLTVGPTGEMARRGMVLGFELVSSRPKLFINLTQAGKQSVAMSADVLKLMTVYR